MVHGPCFPHPLTRSLLLRQETNVRRVLLSSLSSPQRETQEVLLFPFLKTLTVLLPERDEEYDTTDTFRVTVYLILMFKER